MSEAQIVYYTPLEKALVSALADVVHVGDYGSLWIHEAEKRVHLTMGDADGDTERGCTSFEGIVTKVVEAVQPFWPEWMTTGGIHEPGSTLVIADEYDPDTSAGWKLVATIGREVTRVDELRAHWWHEIIHAYVTANEGRVWLSAEKYAPGSVPPQMVEAGHKMDAASRLLHEAVEILRPLAKPEDAA